ncbi:carbonic anhydrase [Primorskyibacter sp. S187A]|uniref:carbonic anhydrase n=1 Tax=Primorskyibacter sp. S187A TaxID=3415130 RepID=UPI003C7C9529
MPNKRAKPLPQFMVHRYHGWKATSYAEDAAWYRKLADEGQRPRAMVVSCCDSRVHVASIFGADHGELFIHRNIANLIPPCAPSGDHHGTSAAIEYAVKVLKVAHLIVMGHSQCGGVRGCVDMCNGEAPELTEADSFTGRWLDMLRPAFEGLPPGGTPEEQAKALEKYSVRVSLANLLTFPFVIDAVEAGTLSLHGVWNDIGTGSLEEYHPPTDDFRPI